MDSGQDDALPVDSLAAAHAIASTTASAASVTTTVDGGQALPIASACVKAEVR